MYGCEWRAGGHSKRWDQSISRYKEGEYNPYSNWQFLQQQKFLNHPAIK
jgi:hypothetical protein